MTVTKDEILGQVASGSLAVEEASDRLGEEVEAFRAEIARFALVGVLTQLKSGQISLDKAAKLLTDLEPKPRTALYCKVSEKGAVSIYGLQRMPVTLYIEQWQRLLDFGDDVRQFLKENDSKLKRKGQ